MPLLDVFEHRIAKFRIQLSHTAGRLFPFIFL